MKKEIKLASWLVLAIAITLGLSISLQSIIAAWDAPGANPPTQSIYKPINEGPVKQKKEGILGLNMGIYDPTHELVVRDNSGQSGIYIWGDGSNAEIALGDGVNHWAIYSDETSSKELRFWRGTNLISISDSGNLTATGQICDTNGCIGGGGGEMDPIWIAAQANYYTKTNMQTSGGAQLHWNNLTSIPVGFSDGIDDNTLYSAGLGIGLSGTSFFVDAGNGLSQTADGLTTLATTCLAGQYSYWNGSQWLCANAGDITAVLAGSGISGGGYSGDVTITHYNTSDQASSNNSGSTFIQDITLDTYGHITSIATASELDPQVGTLSANLWCKTNSTGTTIDCNNAAPTIAEADGVIGNEVTNTTNSTLTRGGSGTSISPYTLGLNLANANIWTGAQTFNSTINHTLEDTFFINSDDDLQLRINADGGIGEFGINNSANSRILTIQDDGDTGIGAAPNNAYQLYVDAGGGYYGVYGKAQTASASPSYGLFGEGRFGLGVTGLTGGIYMQSGGIPSIETPDNYLILKSTKGIHIDGASNTGEIYNNGNLTINAENGANQTLIRSASVRISNSTTAWDWANRLDVDGLIKSTGNLVVSDVRMKKDIQTIDNALEKVNQLRGVTYKWKEGKGNQTGEEIGVIAQEVEKVLPQVVVTDSNGYKAVDYSKFSSLLIEAFKEQSNVLAEKERKIEDLEDRIKNIEEVLKYLNE